jgi:hypothetical protein
VAIEIEDRGLGMSEEDLKRVNHSLQAPAEFDVMSLPDLSKLGFWVIPQLAKSHGIRVQLIPSPYGGITAVVVLPSPLLANLTRSGQQPGEQAFAGEHTSPAPTPAPNPLPPMPHQTTTVDDTSDWPTQAWPAIPSAARSNPVSPGLGDPAPFSTGELPAPPRPYAARDGLSGVADSAPSTSEHTPARHSAPDNDTRPHLPERQRGHHMAPQLRVAEQPEPDSSLTHRRPTPEATRDIYSAYQRGSRSGRQS